MRKAGLRGPTSFMCKRCGRSKAAYVVLLPFTPGLIALLQAPKLANVYTKLVPNRLLFA